MTTKDIFTVAGRLKKWDINCGEFTMEAPVGDIVINIEKCDDLMLNEMIDAMKAQRFARTNRFLLSIPKTLGRVRLTTVAEELLAEHIGAWCDAHLPFDDEDDEEE